MLEIKNPEREKNIIKQYSNVQTSTFLGLNGSLV